MKTQGEIKFFMLAASGRRGSLNHRLISAAAEKLPQIASDLAMGLSVDLANFREFDMPVYDGDLEDSEGMPKGALALVRRIQDADAIILSTPEYNGGIPGSLKNAIDWTSRADQNPLDGKPLLLLSASPGALGGVRGLWHTRVPFEAQGALVYAEMFALSRAHAAFAEDGSLTHENDAKRLSSALRNFLGYATRLNARRDDQDR